MIQTCISAPPFWKICLWIGVLLLTLALLVGAAIGAVEFLRWREIW